MAGVHCYSAVRLLSEHVQGSGVGSCPLLSQELQALLSRMGEFWPFPASGAWQGVARATVAQQRSRIQVTTRRFRDVTPPFTRG